MISWLDIVFAISIGICALLGLIVFIEWNIYKVFEHKRFKKHLETIEKYQKENKDE